ncbi:hypothetical protein [Clostridium sp. D33t1_170424_F3]|uniref:hypothetical protein n=1 Tax=Clostridium sp. D33t1_170424_F3 TaxID=2787099 RepID=UPI0018AB5669|nr:hypothetical protein [Clostridium sp. D33t1_170424_F3]
MKCPYAVNTRIITQISFEHDDNGIPTTQTAIENQEIAFPDCLERDCAAWIDGRCQYRGVN